MAKAGELTLTYGEAREEVEMTKTQYAALMEYYYGQSIDTADEDYQRFIAENVVQGVMQQKVLLQKFDDLGLAITDERMAEIEKQAQADYDSMYEQYTEMYKAQLGLAGGEDDEAVTAQVKENVEALFAENSYTVENLTESAVVSEKLNMLYEYATRDVTVTDEDVKAAYDQKIAEAKERYDADKDQFLNDYMSGAEVVYTPEGIRLIQHVLVMKTDDPAEEEATPSDATPEEATPSDAELSGRAKAEKALAEIEGGKDFMEAVAAYGEDAGMEQELLAPGYPVFAGSASYDQSFVDNAMALKNVGDVSGIVAVSYTHLTLPTTERV